MKIKHADRIRGEVTVPGDKSISHRSIMLGALAKGNTEIHNFLEGADCLSTISCFSKMGISIEDKNGIITVHGKGLHGLSAPDCVLDCGNSGTTTRLISGILAPQPFSVVLTGDASIHGTPLKGIHYVSKVASAQVKSCILLAGLYAEGETSVTEPQLSRNHTELMLRFFGADVTSNKTTASIRPASELRGRKIMVPGDISSAVYFVAAGLLLPNSEVLIRNVGINPTRAGLLTVCRKMGAELELLNEDHSFSEPTADLLIRSGSLKGTVIDGALIPAMIDELPTVALMACFAEGTTIIKDAQELKVKESNRIAITVENLRAMGADVEETEDGMIIHGGRPLHGAVIDSHKDHRIAMTFAIAALAAEGETEILDADCVDISYPAFFQDLKALTKN